MTRSFTKGRIFALREVIQKLRQRGDHGAADEFRAEADRKDAEVRRKDAELSDSKNASHKDT